MRCLSVPRDSRARRARSQMIADFGYDADGIEAARPRELRSQRADARYHVRAIEWTNEWWAGAHASHAYPMRRADPSRHECVTHGVSVRSICKSLAPRASPYAPRARHRMDAKSRGAHAGAAGRHLRCQPRWPPPGDRARTMPRRAAEASSMRTHWRGSGIEPGGLHWLRGLVTRSRQPRTRERAHPLILVLVRAMGERAR